MLKSHGEEGEKGEAKLEYKLRIIVSVVLGKVKGILWKDDRVSEDLI